MEVKVQHRFTDTGIGKTRIAIALADPLIGAGWIKRVNWTDATEPDRN